MRYRLLLSIAAVAWLPGTPAIAQFGTVINAPPTVIGDDQSIGSHTQLNVFAGGVVGDNFDAGTYGSVGVDIEVNISGGTVGDNFQANQGSVVNISGGTVGSAFHAEEGSTVHVTGGSIDSVAIFGGAVADISSGTVGRLNLYRGTANVTGGVVGVGVYGFGVSRDCLLNISGGLIGGGVAFDGSTLNISGGAIGDELETQAGSSVSLIGGEFRLNGELIVGLENAGDAVPFNLPAGATLSGTFADGTPFVFTSDDQDDLANGTITLRAAALPPIGPAQISVPSDPAPYGIRAGQTLTVSSGGAVGDEFQAGRGSTVDVTGGSVGENLEAVHATVNISGGTVGRYMDAFEGTVVNLTGGAIERNADAFRGSVFNISGGVIGDFFRAHGGSIVNITGGTVGGPFSNSLTALAGSEVNILGGTVLNDFDIIGGTVNIDDGVVYSFDAFNGSVVTISGGSVGGVGSVNVQSGSRVDVQRGTIGRTHTYAGGQLNVSGGSWRDNFDADTGSDVRFYGGEFRIDGVPVAGLETEGSSTVVAVPAGAVFSGTFADGTPFAFSSQNFDTFADGSLTLHAVGLPPAGPATFNVPADASPVGLRTGQSLLVGPGGTIGTNFTAGWGTSVAITGGQVGTNFEAVGAAVAISGGFVQHSFDAFRDTVVDISGGTVSRMSSHQGSVVNVTGGVVGLIANDGSRVQVTGGTLSVNSQANSGSIVNIAGGTVDESFSANSGSLVNISGGSIGDHFRAAGGSVVNIWHGSIGDSVDALSGSALNIHGGTIGDDFDADAQSAINLFGTQFVLNGINITNTLPYNAPMLITDRNVTLSGVLADNSAFEFGLYTVDARSRDFFASGAMLTVTRVLPGDFNVDGVVDAADYVVWRKRLGAPFAQADYALWRRNFHRKATAAGATVAAGSAALPEASGVAMLVSGIVAAFRSRHPAQAKSGRQIARANALQPAARPRSTAS
jgi:hypothetical protein